MLSFATWELNGGLVGRKEWLPRDWESPSDCLGGLWMIPEFPGIIIRLCVA